MEILKAETLGITDLNLSPEYHEKQQKIARALSYVGDQDILILEANHPALYQALLDIELTLED